MLRKFWKIGVALPSTVGTMAEWFRHLPRRSRVARVAFVLAFFGVVIGTVLALVFGWLGWVGVLVVVLGGGVAGLVSSAVGYVIFDRDISLIEFVNRASYPCYLVDGEERVLAASAHLLELLPGSKAIVGQKIDDLMHRLLQRIPVPLQHRYARWQRERINTEHEDSDRNRPVRIPILAPPPKGAPPEAKEKPCIVTVRVNLAEWSERVRFRLICYEVEDVSQPAFDAEVDRAYDLLDDDFMQMVHDSDSSRKDVFLSFNSKDRDEVRRIDQRLRGERLTTFFDQESMGPGDSIEQRLGEGLRQCRTVALFLSGAGWGAWQLDEALAAREIFPVILPPAAARRVVFPHSLQDRIHTDLSGADDERERQILRLIEAIKDRLGRPRHGERRPPGHHGANGGNGGNWESTAPV